MPIDLDPGMLFGVWSTTNSLQSHIERLPFGGLAPVQQSTSGGAQFGPPPPPPRVQTNDLLERGSFGGVCFPLRTSFDGKEHALVVSNHKSDIDWLVGWLLAQRSGCLGSALAVMKKSSKFLPVIGWSMWFSEYLFLERSWAKDEKTLKSGLQQLQDFPRPFWLALFVEGTRFTQAKLKAAQEYAASAGLPVPRNVLIPRTKGFVSAVSEMRSFVPAIYEVTVAIPKSSPPPTMLRLFKGKSSVTFHWTSVVKSAPRRQARRGALFGPVQVPGEAL
ncbi:hypothetical protein TEA_002972 [Camellia sinensis var. sinensis]|uniref:Phospholipid/glycerol acyltransferase domain-containing protein n=1 Tax=Camellia sinensis var. sinensis TaxID=542762 RepID=A0A4S4DAF9_CAMSN|nr:hypothetical protein TEA_002972 [Camellia sinensis var. sinensis]